jgi:hypothetical protein
MLNEQIAGLPLLPDLPSTYISARLSKSPGNEIASGKFANPESSAALAVNAFGWFIERPRMLPPFPGLQLPQWSPVRVDVEESLRFPWRGGLHPWLDAVVETDAHLIGVESKRCEPFRSKPKPSLSTAYWRDVWGENMKGWQSVRDSLRDGTLRFNHLDAAQLVKHSLGLRTQARKLQHDPVLLYLFAEPLRVGGRTISPSEHAAHRAEIDALAQMVAGDEVRFAAVSYSEWLNTWPDDAATHGRHLSAAFNL